MALFALGVSHHTAGVGQREKASLSGGRACSLLRALARETTITEVAALSTCNRTELYAAADSPDLVHATLAQALAQATEIGLSELAEISYALRGPDVARHLIRVAASLDSMVIGESEVQGQVRGALNLAEAHGTAGPELRELFRRALIAGKRVRSQTAISRGAISVSSVAVELARDALPDLTGASALLIGAGHVAEATAGALIGAGVGDITVANRSVLTAQELGGRFGGRGVSLDEIEDELQAADIVICSTDAPYPILSFAGVRRAMERRHDRPLLLIDIAVPRDVEAEVEHLPAVALRNIDDLERVVHTNLNGRLQEARRAEEIVEEELSRLGARMISRPKAKPSRRADRRHREPQPADRTTWSARR